MLLDGCTFPDKELEQVLGSSLVPLQVERGPGHEESLMTKARTGYSDSNPFSGAFRLPIVCEGWPARPWPVCPFPFTLSFVLIETNPYIYGRWPLYFVIVYDLENRLPKGMR